MFIKGNIGFEMFGKAVARRDVPTNYYHGGIYENHLEILGDNGHEVISVAIAENVDGWAIYPVGRNHDNLEDGPREPFNGLFFKTFDEVVEYAEQNAYSPNLHDELA